MRRAISRNRSLRLILLLALALRLVYALAQDHLIVYRGLGGDSGWYLANGVALAAGADTGTFHGLPVDLSRVPTAPLYLLFLGFWQLILSPEAAVIAIRIGQAILGAATCYFAYRLTRLLSGRERTALLAAGVLAISPAFIIEAANIATESLYLFFVTAGLWVYVEWGAGIRTDQPPGRWSGGLALAGVLLGLATLTRAVLLLFPLGLTIHLLLISGWRTGLKRAGVLIVFYALLVSTWSVYNLTKWNRLVIGAEGMSSFLFIGAVGWNGPQAVDASLAAVIPDSADTTGDERQTAFLDAAGQVIGRDLPGYLRRRVVELINAHLQPHGTVAFPGESLKALALDWLRQDRSVSGLIELSSSESFWPKLSLYLFHYAGLLAGTAGLWMLRRQWRLALPLAGFILYTALIHLALLALPRYIFPTEVLWWVFAAIALAALVDHVRNWRARTTQHPRVGEGVITGSAEVQGVD